MKTTAVKRISAVLLITVFLFVFSSAACAETFQDRIENQLNDLADQYESADDDTRAELENSFDEILGQFGLGDFDLGSLTDADIGSIMDGLDDSPLGDAFGIVTDAFSSGIAMIQDAVNGGLGTSDGSNTATTKPSAGGSPNVIETVPQTQAPTSAVGIPSVNVTVPQAQPSTSEATTYDVGTTAPQDMVGAELTTAANVNLDNVTDSGMDTSSVAVLVVLSFSTLAVIVAIVIFFVLKKK